MSHQGVRVECISTRLSPLFQSFRKPVCRYLCIFDSFDRYNMKPSVPEVKPSTVGPTEGEGGWTVEQIPKDTEHGRKLYHGVYRPFRLKMLKEAPNSFSSTLARETAFDEEVWERRFENPLALTFVALVPDQSHQSAMSVGKIVSALTLRGPFHIPPHQGEDVNVSTDPYWEINAVYTDLEYRRMGIASAVLEEAVQHVISVQQKMGLRRFSLKVGVMMGNEEAKALYEKAGFVLVGKDSDGGDDLVRYFGGD
ncbi:hypothetical protein B0T16DRAFT_226451 [Cercophora newfieldiana]|uniref:N-acetyltransferase domain-containing protein n=1 Tax=Cercophora newfieldiana TaxID=92897 RepID=A0AA39XQS6_9PEZI|nr:hypothetical protein B0T16DRAFT_226451 [Cercophora newfieldiana]